MTMLNPVVTFLPMARRTKETAPPKDQINFRFERPLIERMERFAGHHPLRPTLTQIAARAIADWLDAHESELPKPHHRK